MIPMHRTRESESLTRSRYNQFFNPNVCHVCKQRFAGRLIVCDQCNLISYCSEQHKMLHLSEHKNICESIAKYLTVKPRHDTLRYLSAIWTIKRNYFIGLIRTDLGRELLTDELEMLFCRRSCLICHQQAELQTCEYCCSAEFCNEHAEEFYRQHHSSICQQLLLLLNLNIMVFQTSVATLRMQFNNIPDPSISYYDTVSFVSGHVLPARRARGMDQRWIETDLIYTDYISGPLTLYYGMQETRLLSRLNIDFLTVHVIGASAVDANGVAAWELFLHFTPEIRILLIVMIGPELSLDYDNMSTICATCQLDERLLCYECYPMLYHDYVISQMYKKPDIIVGFQAELRYSETWSASIKKLQSQNCPLILTATSLDNIVYDMIAIKEVLGVKPDLMRASKFPACRPYRDLQNDCVCYRNQYIMVYEKLRHPILL